MRNCARTKPRKLMKRIRKAQRAWLSNPATPEFGAVILDEVERNVGFQMLLI